MTREELQWKINSLNTQINQKNNEKSSEEQKRNQLLNFQTRTASKVNNFSMSISNRKTRVNSIFDLTSTVTLAKGFFDKMNSLLTGREYSTASSNVDNFKNAISNELNRLNGKISNLQTQINSLTSERNYYQQQLNNLPVEVSDNE